MTLWRWLQSRGFAKHLPNGQGLVEYALILVFVAVVLIAILTVLSPGIVNIYQNILDHL
jgi:pilus assembly protein Flp/PilA